MERRERPGAWSPTDSRSIAVALVCAAVILVAARLSVGFPRGSAVRIALALIEGGASSLVIVNAMRSIARRDELQQRIQLEALAFAFACTGVLASSYGFLVLAGLPNIDWGTFVWPAMVVLWATGALIARRRYR